MWNLFIKFSSYTKHDVIDFLVYGDLKVILIFEEYGVCGNIREIWDFGLSGYRSSGLEKS